MVKRKKLVFSVIFLFLALGVYSAQVDLSALITLDIKGMDILDVLKIISLRSGLSIAASPLVRGKVTIFLKDVSVWDGFEILIAANDLAYEMKGNLVTVMTNKEYEDKYGRKFYDLRVIKRYNLRNAKAESLAKTVEQLKSKIGKVIADSFSNSLIVLDTPDVLYEIDKVIREMDSPLETKVIQLNYARVKDIKENISDLVSKDIGTIKFDEGSNRVIVTDLPRIAEHIEKVLKALDKRPKAVQIEAKIIDIILSDEYRYGVDWGAVFGKEAGIFYKGTLPTPEQTGIGKLAIGEVVFAEDNPLSAKHQYRGLFKLFNTFGKTDVLSSPRLTVLDAQEAYVLVGVREPLISVTATYPEGYIEPVYSETVQYVETGVRLTVTPYISEEEFIKMKIKPEVSSAEVLTTERGSRYPIKTTSETETTVIVKDGSTIILAGLMKEATEKKGEKVPGLGDIPLIGKIFSGKYEKAEKKELVILLTPRIVTGDEVTAIAKKEIRPELGKEQLGIEPEEQEYKKMVGKVMPIKEAEEALAKDRERQEYSEYYLVVTNRIYDYLKRNYLDLGLRGEVNIVFLLDKNGNLVGEPAVIGDVEPTIRDLAIEIVKRAGPYPGFPQELAKEKEAFNILLSF